MGDPVGGGARGAGGGAIRAVVVVGVKQAVAATGAATLEAFGAARASGLAALVLR